MLRTRLIALCVAAAAALAHLDGCTAALNDYAVPAVDYTALTHSPDARAALLHALQTDGIVALRNVPAFAAQRASYLATAASCAVVAEQHDAEFVLHRTLSDGTQRLTISTESGRKLSESGRETLAHCPGYLAAYQTFSQLVEDAVSSVGRALDATQALHITTGAHVALTARELLSDSVHLDHFHAYEAASSSAKRSLVQDDKADNAELSLAMHTDNGLLIAMTAPEYFDVAPTGDVRPKHTRSEDVGLIIQTARGETVRPVLVADELVLMLGNGAREWITTHPTLQPVLHGMQFPRGLSYATDSATAHKVLRAWFGKMILLPADAVMANTGLTYSAYANHTARYLMESNADVGFAAVACPLSRSLQASDKKCMTKICSLKPTGDATAMVESCQVTCNHDNVEDVALCKTHCVCESQSVAGHQCWMLCVADVSADECPSSAAQTCNDAFTLSTLAMKCAATDAVAAPVTTAAPATPSTLSTPSPSPLKTTKAPTSATKAPSPTSKKPLLPSMSSSSSSRADDASKVTTPPVKNSNASSDTSIEEAGATANSDKSAASSAASSAAGTDVSKVKTSAALATTAVPPSPSVVFVSVVVLAVFVFA